MGTGCWRLQRRRIARGDERRMKFLPVAEQRGRASTSLHPQFVTEGSARHNFCETLVRSFQVNRCGWGGGGGLLAEDIAQLLRSCSLLHLQLSVLVPVNGWLCQKPRLKFHFWEATAVSKLILSKTQVHLRKAGKLNLVRIFWAQSVLLF